MFHASEAVLALSREENPTVFQKTLGLNDFYFGSDEHDYPLGNIQMVGKSQAPMFHGERPTETKLAPHWSLERIAKHAIDFWLSTEDLPMPENRVTVDREGRLTLAYKPTNDVPKQELYKKLKSILGKLRMEPDHLFGRFAYMKNDIPVAGCAHQAGTCRFGSDPATSALNVDCRAHEVDNLYVVDTSVFPSIGAVNPALTAMANSLRVGDHLLARMASLMRDAPPVRRADRDSRSGDQRVVVVEVGGGLRSYTVGGRRPPRRLRRRRDGDRRARPGAHPVAEPDRGRRLRVRRASRHQLPLNEPEARNAIHGLVRWVAWSVGEREPDRVVMEHTLRPQPGYPFSLGLSIEYALSDKGLRVTTTATNIGSEACPYGSGMHPYLTVGTQTVDTVVLRAPGRTVLHADERGVPVGTRPWTAPSSTSAGPGRSARRSSTTRSPISSATTTGSHVSSFAIPTTEPRSRSGSTRPTRTCSCSREIRCRASTVAASPSSR